MTKKMKGLIATAVVALLAGYGISRSLENNAPELSATTLANIEAITDDEGGGEDLYQTGPGDVRRTGFWGRKVKFCLSENSHYCRETL